jgi:hypothetical protein
MDNITGNPKNYYTKEVKKTKKVKIETDTIEQDPESIKEFINDYLALTSKCEAIYDARNNKEVGDVLISLETIKNAVNKLTN